MQSKFSNIAMITLPFAGVALGWYLFMPNFEWLRTQEQYRSQALIDIMRTQNILAELKYQLFTPKALRDWNACVLKSGGDFLEARLHENESGEYVTAEWTKKTTIDAYKKEKCGSRPLSKN